MKYYILIFILNDLFFTFVVVLRDEFRTEPKNKKVIQGETVILECGPPRGHPEPIVYWKKNGQNLEIESNKR